MPGENSVWSWTYVEWRVQTPEYLECSDVHPRASTPGQPNVLPGRPPRCCVQWVPVRGWKVRMRCVVGFHGRLCARRRRPGVRDEHRRGALALARGIYSLDGSVRARLGVSGHVVASI